MLVGEFFKGRIHQVDQNLISDQHNFRAKYLQNDYEYERFISC